MGRSPLHHLIGLANYWEGGSLAAELAGPACRTGIAYPVVTGNFGLSLFDARKLAGFADDLLLLSLPFHRMIAVMHALERRARRSRDRGPAARSMKSTPQRPRGCAPRRSARCGTWP